ncbi:MULTISPECIES: alpha/beta fold hydrolase [Pseudomonas]|uniref:alpha/beta fold hydrolase n=1 Tax=Pseudomonas TaxID=286 RepID=UPI00300199CE
MKKLVAALLLLVAATAGVLYVFPATMLWSVQWVGERVAGVSSRQIEVADLSIHYYEGGPAGAETLLLVHGFGGDKSNWLKFVGHFTGKYHVIALDLPGFGDSSKPQLSFDVGTQAERLLTFTDALNLPPVNLVGNSMGGHISALYAARYPQRVKSLALFDNAGITAPVDSVLFKRLKSGQSNPLLIQSRSDFKQMLNLVFVNVPPMPERLNNYLADRAIASYPRNNKIFEQLQTRYIALEPELGKIQVPTLLLWGDQDQILDISSMAVMQPLLAKPSTAVINNCGHVPMLECPDETAQQYQQFLTTNSKG